MHHKLILREIVHLTWYHSILSPRTHLWVEVTICCVIQKLAVNLLLPELRSEHL